MIETEPIRRQTSANLKLQTQNWRKPIKNHTSIRKPIAFWNASPISLVLVPGSHRCWCRRVRERQVAAQVSAYRKKTTEKTRTCGARKTAISSAAARGPGGRSRGPRGALGPRITPENALKLGTAHRSRRSGIGCGSGRGVVVVWHFVWSFGGFRCRCFRESLAFSFF